MHPVFPKLKRVQAPFPSGSGSAQEIFSDPDELSRMRPARWGIKRHSCWWHFVYKYRGLITTLWVALVGIRTPVLLWTVIKKNAQYSQRGTLRSNTLHDFTNTTGFFSIAQPNFCQFCNLSQSAPARKQLSESGKKNNKQTTCKHKRRQSKKGSSIVQDAARRRHLVHHQQELLSVQEPDQDSEVLPE